MSEITENTFTSYLGPEFQQRLMWQLLVEPEFAEKTIPILAVEYFDDPNLRRLFLIILEFHKEYGKVPNLQNQSIQQAINQFKTPNNVIEEESLFAVIKRIELWNERVLNQALMHDGDVVQKATNDFIKQQEYRKIAENIIIKTKNGELKKKHTIVEIEEKFQKVSLIGADEDCGSDVTEGLESALRKEFRQTIPTGVVVIDELTGGGLGKGEFGLILTPSGVGKTTLLTVIANTARANNKNVLQIIFEDTKEQIQRKHVTIWTKIPLSQLDDRNEEALAASNKHIESLGPGKLTIKKFSQEDTTMRDVKDFILREQKKWGFKFDIVVLDYLDCLESHKKVGDRNEAELVIVKAFEALASDLNIPCWSAIQSNRSGFDAELVEAYQSGGNIKRVQKAHFFMSVAKTPDQKEASLASIRIIKARFAKDGQTFKDCIFNNDTMQIIIKDDRYVGNRYSGLKKMGQEELNKMENKTAIINHGLISAALPDTQFDDTLLGDMALKYLEQNNTVIQKFESEGVNGGINEGIKDTEMIEIEDDKQIETVSDAVNDVVSDAVNDGVNTGSDIIDCWSGETETVDTGLPEVKFEDVKPLSEPEPTAKASIDLSVFVPPGQDIYGNPKKFEQKSDDEIVFDDPDSVPKEQKHVFDILKEMAKNQKVIPKE